MSRKNSPMEARDTFGYRMRMQRLARGWSLSAVAERSGLSETTISRIEWEHVTPSEITQQKLTLVFEGAPPQPDRSSFGSLLHSLRVEKKIPLTSLASMTGIHPSVLFQWEHDETQPRSKVRVHHIEDALSLERGTLLALWAPFAHEPPAGFRWCKGHQDYLPLSEFHKGTAALCKKHRLARYFPTSPPPKT